MSDQAVITIIGAGLAGAEAALTLANWGYDITLYEMKPVSKSPAHHMDGMAELVCSNSLKAKRTGSGSGLLKEEMRRLGSQLLLIAEDCAVPAGGALAVDRTLFSERVTEAIDKHPRITVKHEKVNEIPSDGQVVIATGPLTDEGLYDALRELTGSRHLRFFDAAAPIVHIDSVDPEASFRQSRYDRGGDDYINCPMDKDTYEAFVNELIGAELAEQHEFDKKLLFEGCMPIESMAKRGSESLRFGPMKPVGLTDPKTGRRPWANLQLRQEGADGALWNLVGFQTRLTFPEQRRVFGMIPALKNAKFERYGVMHRNSFIDSPRVLSWDFSLKAHPNIYVIGQLSGLEGYVPAMMSGVWVAWGIRAKLQGKMLEHLPSTLMISGLLRYMTDTSLKDFQPMTASFGLLPELPERIKDKAKRGEAYAERALNDLDKWITMHESGII